MEFEKETALCETILFLESEPLTVKVLASKAGIDEETVEKVLENLNEKYAEESSGIELAQITGGWCLVPKKDTWEVLKEFYGSKREGKLSKSAMETLAIIAYSQPITRAEIEKIRGVGVDNMIRLLIERNLIQEVGKKEVPGRPTLFGTTKEFLKLFHLNSISELPKLDEEEEARFVLAR